MRFGFPWLCQLKCLHVFYGMNCREWFAGFFFYIEKALQSPFWQVHQDFGIFWHLHLDFYTRGCPTPWLASHKAISQISPSFTLILTAGHAILNAIRQCCLSHLSHSSSVLKQHFLTSSLLLMQRKGRRDKQHHLVFYSRCCVASGAWLIFILRPTLAGTQ